MRGAALPVFLLLAFLEGAPGGELCRRWAKGSLSPVSTFSCPGRPNGVRAAFCCGTCYKPYCCSSEAARLDQAWCPDGDRRQVILRASEDDLKTFATMFGIAAGLISAVIFYTVCNEIFRCVKSLRSAQWRSRILDPGPSRPSFCSTSLAFLNDVCSRLRCGDCSFPHRSSRAAPAITPHSAEDPRQARVSSLPHADRRVHFHQVASETPEEDSVIISPPAPLPRIAISGGTPGWSLATP